MTELVPDAIYRIKLCSDEIRQWQYLGPDSRSLVWWRDVETSAEFNESSLMYAWEIVPDEDVPPTDKDRNS